MPAYEPDVAPPPKPDTYARLTRTATYSFLATMPLLLLYEVLVVVANRGSLAQVRVGADVWIKRVLATVGGGGMIALGIVVLLIGIGVFVYERRDNIPIRPRYFGWMLAESMGWAIVLALLISTFVGALFAVAPQGAERPGTFMMLALSLGAGLYEELFFRVLLVGGLFWLLHQAIKRPRTEAYVVAAVVGALIFSGVHYLGALGDVFTLPSFTFRFLFGLALNALFLVRGFGVAAWAHALYDVIVTLGLLG